MTGRENKEFEFVKLAKRALRLKSFVSRETVIQVFFAFIPVKVSRFDSFRLKEHSDSLDLLNFFLVMTSSFSYSLLPLTRKKSRNTSK